MSAGTPRGAGLCRALQRRCPACGCGLFTDWFRIAPVCAGCGLRTDRGEPDYFLGAMLVNLVLAESIPVVVVGGVVVLTWPAPPWGLLLWAGATLALVAPFVGYPYSKTLWLYVDMQVREATHLGVEAGGPTFPSGEGS